MTYFCINSPGYFIAGGPEIISTYLENSIEIDLLEKFYKFKFFSKVEQGFIR
jgi:hypothetical protein